jgi:serine/threonine protein phosphatase PrpC
VFSPRDGLRQVTRDHSLIAALVTAKLLVPDALYTHPRRGQIFRCLGRQRHVQVDTFEVRLGSDDRILLCTRGLWAMARDPQIEAIVRVVANLHLAAGRLATAAIRNGGQDNLSIIVARRLDDYPLHQMSPSEPEQNTQRTVTQLPGVVSTGQL